MKLYQVTAKRWAHGWELNINGVGVTQSHSLVDAEEMAREYIALDTGTDPGKITVVITPEVDDLVERARAARRKTDQAFRAQQEAAYETREIAKALKAKGLTGRDIAVVLDVSAQRISQLLAG